MLTPCSQNSWVGPEASSRQLVRLTCTYSPSGQCCKWWGNMWNLPSPSSWADHEGVCRKIQDRLDCLLCVTGTQHSWFLTYCRRPCLRSWNLLVVYSSAHVILQVINHQTVGVYPCLYPLIRTAYLGRPAGRRMTIKCTAASQLVAHWSIQHQSRSWPPT